MDPTQATALVAAIGVVITAITALISVLRNTKTLDIIHTNTNSTLSHLEDAAATATEQRATAAELAARPALPAALNGANSPLIEHP